MGGGGEEGVTSYILDRVWGEGGRRELQAIFWIGCVGVGEEGVTSYILDRVWGEGEGKKIFL